MFNLSVQEIEELCNGKSFRVPDNLSSEQFLYWVSLSEQACEEISCMNYPKAKEEIKRQMIIKKVWDDEILNIGGLSFIKDEETSRIYKVSMTNKSNNIVYKWRIKTASGEIFSVCSKTSRESQKIVNKIYGKNKYTVSMMLL